MGPRGRVAAPEVSGELLPGGALRGHDQGDPVGDRQGGQRGLEFTMLLIAQGDGIGSVGLVTWHEARGEAPEATVGRQGARCAVCETPVPLEHARSESRAKRMGAQLMAIVAEGVRGRIYLGPDLDHIRTAESAKPVWGPEEELADWPGHINVYRYGLTRFRDLFTPRQLVALTTFSDLVGEARERALDDAVAAGLPDDATPLHAGGFGATAYADAVATYLAFAVDRSANTLCTIARWTPGRDQTVTAFARQAIPMTWDYPEVNPFSGAAGDYGVSIEGIVEALSVPAGPPSFVNQLDATLAINGVSKPLISTDPPYYDNIGYSDLSDFFYVWLRRSLGSVFPDLFGTLLTPKAQELVAVPYRFDGSKERAERHFEQGLGEAFARIHASAHPDYPVTVYYAFKQAESEDDTDGGRSIASTGWETMLEALLRAGFSVDGTWPVRTELANKIAMGNNMLASSIVLVCRPRSIEAGMTTRKDFVVSLKRELPEALRTLQHGNVAPVDLAQASIGPGMAVFSRYAKVLEPDGSAMRIRTALALINGVLDELLTEQEGEFDADTRWAIAWYEQFGLGESAYGTAETLSKAKNSSVAGLVEAGIVQASRGRVRLLARHEYSADWDPAKDTRIPVWEATQRLVHLLLIEGEGPAGDLLARLGGLGDTARDLAYRMYHVAERKGWSDEARAYNALVVAWTDLARGAESARAAQPAQASLGLE